MKIKFVILDECNLCYIDPWTKNSLHVLASSSIIASVNKYGVAYDWRNGAIARPIGDKGLRPAKIADFKTFRVSTCGYDSDAAYDFPTE